MITLAVAKDLFVWALRSRHLTICLNCASWHFLLTMMATTTTTIAYYCYCYNNNNNYYYYYCYYYYYYYHYYSVSYTLLMWPYVCNVPGFSTLLPHRWAQCLAAKVCTPRHDVPGVCSWAHSSASVSQWAADSEWGNVFVSATAGLWRVIRTG